MFKVKPPQPENIDKILQIDSATGGKWSKADLYDFLSDNSNTQRNRIYLAEENDKIVGFITAEFPAELTEPIIIKKISIDKAHRLKGYGRKLFSHIYDMAELRKYKSLEIIFDEGNIDGLKFIKKIAHIDKSSAKRGAYHITVSIQDEAIT